MERVSIYCSCIHKKSHRWNILRPSACPPFARLKMGVCEGFPKSIIPDHLARADYHGASVNQSARYMDAGREGEGGSL